MTVYSNKNLYKILEVPSNASKDTIKRAYRKLVRIYHPDINGGSENFTQRFKEITEAYEVLSDDAKRRDYDILQNIKNYDANKYQTQENKKPEFKKTTCDDTFSDLLNEFWTGFKKTTEYYKKNYQANKQKKYDVETELVLTSLEAQNGCIKTVNILHTQSCTHCHGRNFLNGTTCPICGGKGTQSVHKKINVKIPQGVKTGAKIRLANEGNSGSGDICGDLYLKIKIEDSKDFTFDGLNVLYNLPITPFEAILGATVHIKTLTGSVAMKILPNTQNEQKFRLKNEGLSQNNQKGDMIVTVKIEIPKKLSPQEIALYNQLKTINNTDIREF